MTYPLSRVAITLLLILPSCASKPAPPVPAHAAVGTAGVVATVHPIATDAGADAFRRHGNAVDAAVAAALMLGVVDSHNSGIGGGCFILIRTADGRFLAIDGRETAPAAATRDMFLKDGKPVPHASTTGALAIGVPGSLAAYDYALKHAGHLALKDLLLPAADVAERGFTVDPHYARKLASVARDLARFPASAQVFLDPAGKPWPSGHLLRQNDLANSYRAIAENGPGWFYTGTFAKELEAWMKSAGGIATADDFAGYRIQLRQPLVTTYRGYTLVGFPPPSSGGVHVAQILNILENFHLKELDRQNPALRLHVMAEAMKLAFADRAYWLGDPAFTPVPRGLVDKRYAKSLADRIDLHRAITVPSHGQPPAAETDTFTPPTSPSEKHTTHITAADAEGNFVAITATVNTTFGSKVVIPHTGIVMNDQMDDFSIQPGTPNAFGLIGGDGNAVAAGKRPLSSMSPTIVLKDGMPLLTIGAAGGPTIITQVVQALINHLDLGMPLPDAVAAPRIHHQWQPDSLHVEASFPAEVITSLHGLGHKVSIRESIGVTQASVRLDNGTLLATHDPRVPGKAEAVDK